MHLKSGIAYADFLREVDLCVGGVFFETPEGDSLDLKNTLFRCVFAAITGNPERMSAGILRLERNEDAARLGKFLTFHEGETPYVRDHKLYHA